MGWGQRDRGAARRGHSEEQEIPGMLNIKQRQFQFSRTVKYIFANSVVMSLGIFDQNRGEGRNRTSSMPRKSILGEGHNVSELSISQRMMETSPSGLA